MMINVAGQGTVNGICSYTPRIVAIERRFKMMGSIKVTIARILQGIIYGRMDMSEAPLFQRGILKSKKGANRHEGKEYSE
jgi:hypothetical protein